RQDVVRHAEVVVGSALPTAHERQQLLERGVERVLVAGVDRGDDGVVELVELVVLAVVEVVLALARDPDDHWAPPPSICPCCGELPEPSSALIWASSSSTTDVVGRPLGCVSLSSSPGPLWRRRARV